MQGQYNMRSPAVKRLMKEAQELNEPTELYHAQPLEDNLFEWHFTLRGPEGSEFDGGIYHGRIILPPEYPMKPPSIILLTPNGRFETFKKICLSISGHHPESWQPSWSIRTALLAIIGFMPTHGGGAIGSLDYKPEERKMLARRSQDWKCPDCGNVSNKLKPRTDASDSASQEAKELASQISFQEEKAAAPSANNTEETSAAPSSAATTSTTSPSPSVTANPNLTQAQFPNPWAMGPAWGLPHPGCPPGQAFPRFPYPPPLMMPPPPRMFMTPAGGQGQGQAMPPFPPVPFFHPMMRGFPPFPPQSAGVAAASSSGTSQSATAPQSQASTPVSSSAVSSSSTRPTSSSSTNEVASTSSSASPETVGGAAAGPTPSAPLSSTPTVTPTVSSTPTVTPTNTTSMPSSSASTTPAANDMQLRQRTTAQPQPSSAAPGASNNSGPASPSGQPATAGSYSPGTVILMFLLSLAITFLLGRRIYLQYFGRDFRGYFE